eukprot:g17216.t1
MDWACTCTMQSIAIAATFCRILLHRSIYCLLLACETQPGEGCLLRLNLTKGQALQDCPRFWARGNTSCFLLNMRYATWRAPDVFFLLTPTKRALLWIGRVPAQCSLLRLQRHFIAFSFMEGKKGCSRYWHETLLELREF